MTLDDARTIGAVLRAAMDAFARQFSSQEARILMADARSTDGTRQVARDAAGAALVEVEYPVPATLPEMPYHGHPGRAGALRAILQAAFALGARACAVVDARLDAPTPERIERLIGPVLADGFDYVSPYYTRRAHEGAITKGIVYPMFRALYGVRLRQPVAGEFGCSARAMAHYLEQDFWDVEHAQSGIDLWLAVEAACSAFRVCEAPLGAYRTTARDAGVDMSTTLAQIVGALFADLEYRVDFWQRCRGSVPVPVVGTAPAAAGEESPVPVDGLIDSFRLGYRELHAIWTSVLPPRTILDLRRLTDAPLERFRFPDRLWAGIVYDFALGYGLRVMPRDHLLRSLAPLYSGWLASFVLETGGAARFRVEERVEQIGVAFEAEKRQLISGWRWPERPR
ncbi:MAG: glycosyl transferase family 2 [Betaproteobacteria bacterium]